MNEDKPCAFVPRDSGTFIDQPPEARYCETHLTWTHEPPEDARPEPDKAKGALYAILGFTEEQIAQHPRWIRAIATRGLQ